MLEQHGYAQGFGTWQAFISAPGQLKPRGDVLRKHSLRWVEQTMRTDPDKPKLLYLQYMEPHTPYEPPQPYRAQFVRGSDAIDEAKAKTKLIEQRRLTPAEIERLESLYDGEVAAVDHELRLLFDELGKAGLLENAIIVITADHGEEFGEHGTMLHGFTLFNGVMRIPLIIVAPGYPAGGVVDDNVSLVDVAPTLLELTGTTPSPSFEGRSLAPLMLPPYAPARISAGLRAAIGGSNVIGEIEPFTGKTDFRRHTQAIVGGDEKLLVNPAGQMVMYNLVKDPLETEQLPPDDALSERLQAYRTDLKERARADGASTRPMDDATREKLRALGYQP
jgi:arylsulfatase A-like enzyme